MGSIIPRKRTDGGTSYLARIVLKHNGAVQHRENRTFATRREAAGWVARREDELRGRDGSLNDPIMADLIARYIAESRREVGRTKAQVLRALASLPFGQLRASRVTSAAVVSLARDLGAGGRQPQTVLNYLSHLGAVCAVARPAWGVELDPTAVLDATKVTKRMGMTAKSRQRDRRPTIEELDRIMDRFARIKASRPSSLPMTEITLFALFSTRRQEEIVRITWGDHDSDRVMIRDMKHPGDKAGNDQWCDLTPEAARVAARQPKTAERIFPYTTDAISAAFTRACQVLGIEDLHFHDLRHEGISRLFEMGWTIPHAAAVSGHRSWQSLKRYTHLRQRGDKYEAWKWRP